MICEKCGKAIGHVEINTFDRDGSDFDDVAFIEEPEDENGERTVALIETNANWTGYELTEEEQRETIKCPHCGEFPFKHMEIQVYEIVRLVCFKSEVAE